MNFIHEVGRIYAKSPEGNVIAEVTFPAVGDTLVNINHTFVDDSLRGKGVAGELMKAVVEELRQKKKKALLTCGYAKVWFERNTNNDDVVQE